MKIVCHKYLYVTYHVYGISILYIYLYIFYTNFIYKISILYTIYMAYYMVPSLWPSIEI